MSNSIGSRQGVRQVTIVVIQATETTQGDLVTELTDGLSLDDKSLLDMVRGSLLGRSTALIEERSDASRHLGESERANQHDATPRPPHACTPQGSRRKGDTRPLEWVQTETGITPSESAERDRAWNAGWEQARQSEVECRQAAICGPSRLSLLGFLSGRTD